MNRLKVVASPEARRCFNTSREVVEFGATDLTDVAAVVLTAQDWREGRVDDVCRSGFDIPVFFAVAKDDELTREAILDVEKVLLQISGVFDLGVDNAEFYGHKLERAATQYEEALLPPFFGALKHYVGATPPSPVRGIRAGSSFANIRRAGSSSISSGRRCFARIAATPTSKWATC